MEFWRVGEFLIPAEDHDGLPIMAANNLVSFYADQRVSSHPVDLDQARPRRHDLAAVPAEAVGQVVHRHHLAEGAAGEASAGDIDEIEPAGPRLDLRLRPHPAQDLFRIRQESEHRGRRCRDTRLAADDEGLLHRSPPWLRDHRGGSSRETPSLY